MADRRHRFAAAVLYHLLLALLFFLPAWLRGHVHLPGDILCALPPWSAAERAETPEAVLKGTDPIEDAWPRDLLYAEGLKQGRLTFWNPRILCGTPFFGDGQTCQLYPPRLLAYRFLPPLVAYEILLVLHLWAAAIGFHLLLLRLNRSPFASLVGSTAWAWGAYQTLWLEWTFAATAGTWIPLSLLFYERAIHARAEGRIPFRSMAAGALCLALLCLSTHLGFAAAGVFCLAVWAAVRFYPARPPGIRPPTVVAAALFILVAGSAAAAVQLLPCMEAAAGSLRTGMTASTHFPFRWGWLAAPLSMVNPRLLGGHPYDFDVYHMTMQSHPWEVVVYAGTAALILAATAVFRRGGDPLIRGMAIFGGIAALFAWGSPVYSAVTAILPFLGSVTPGRFLVVAHLALCLAAAAGIDAAQGGNPGSSGRWILRLSWGGWGVLAAGAAVVAAAGVELLGDRGAVRWYALSNPPMLWTIALAGAGIASVHALFRNRSWGRHAVLGILLLEMMSFGWESNPTSPPSRVYPTTPALEWLKNNAGDGRVWARRNREFWGWPMPNTLMPYGIPVVEGFEAVMPEPYVRLANAAAGLPQGTYQRKVAFPDLKRPPPREWLRLCGVKYILADPGDPPPYEGLELAYPPRGAPEDLRIYRMPDALPRAWMVHRLRHALDASEMLAQAGAGTFKPESEAISSGVIAFDPETGLLGAKDLPRLVGRLSVAGLDGSGHPDARSRVLDFLETGDAVRITVETNRPGILVIPQAAAGGWTADAGRPDTALLRVNVAFQGVLIETPGVHEVTLRYRPDYFETGLWISILTFLILGVAVFRRGKAGVSDP